MPQKAEDLSPKSSPHLPCVFSKTLTLTLTVTKPFASPSMGCSYSNLEPDENRPPAGRFSLQWLRLRRGKNCVISTTELLHRDNPDAATTATPCSDWKVHSGRSKLTLFKENEEERVSSTMRSNNEELPGSPSFRFYFNTQPVASDDDGDYFFFFYFSPLGKNKFLFFEKMIKKIKN